MLDWLKRRMSTARTVPTPAPRVVHRHVSNKGGKYRLLYEYLEHRFANTVVLTFAQIEDLLGFALPDLARTDLAWWTITDGVTAGATCSDAWTLAGRTAKANLAAQIVVFERVS
jgi:hypothetical protein